MNSFQREFPEVRNNASKLGWLTSVLQLGGWVGSLSAGVFGEVFSRKHTMFAGALWVVLGSFLAAGAQSTSYLYAGRLFTGLGVGTLSAIGRVFIELDRQHSLTFSLGLSTMLNYHLPR